MANRDPAADRAGLDRLWGCLSRCRADTVVVVPTVDVYPVPQGGDEHTPVLPAGHHAYGRHRRLLEQWVAARFPRVPTVRLPGLYGPGHAAFGVDFTNDLGPVPRYDVRTRYVSVFGGRGSYLETQSQVITGLRAFLAAERGRLDTGVT